MPTCKLNPKIFDSTGKMLPAVRETVLKIKDDIITDLKEEHGFTLKYIAFIMSGSLTGANYDNYSDFDLHFLINYEIYTEENRELIKDYLALYKDAFNRNEYVILDYNVELYFQDITEPHRSPGIYDIDKEEWLKDPDCYKTSVTPNIVELVRKFSNEIEEFIQRFHSRDYPDLEEFMDELKAYNVKLKEFRNKGMLSPKGQYSDENLAFKQLRRSGDLKKLTNLKKDVRKKLYSMS